MKLSYLVKGCCLGVVAILASGCGSDSDGEDGIIIDPGGLAVEGSEELKFYLAQGYDLVSKLDEFLIRTEVITNKGEFVCHSGSVDGEHIDVDVDDELGTGDSLTFKFDNCKASTGEIINGDVVLSLDAEVVLEPFTLLNGAISSLSDLSMTHDGATVVGNGKLSQSFSIDTEGKTSLSCMTLEDESVVFTMGDMAFTATGYQLKKEIEVDGRGDFSIDATVAVKSDTASYGYTVETNEDFETISGAEFPTSGELTLTTLEGRAAKIKVIGDLVRISENLDGDDIFEVQNDLTWSEFFALKN